MRFKRMTGALIAAIAVALAPSAVLASSQEPTPASAPEPAGPVAGKERFVAVPVIKGAKGDKTADDPPPFECQWGWDGSVGGFYPEAWLKYAATFECGEDFEQGPDISGTIRGSLHDSPGGLIRHTGPDEGFLFWGLAPDSVQSGGEITLTGPGQKFYIKNDSIVDLLPNPQEPGTLWVWAYLPAGCEGVGSPRAVCTLNSGEWAIN